LRNQPCDRLNTPVFRPRTYTTFLLSPPFFFIFPLRIECRSVKHRYCTTLPRLYLFFARAFVPRISPNTGVLSTVRSPASTKQLRQSHFVFPPPRPRPPFPIVAFNIAFPFFFPQDLPQVFRVEGTCQVRTARFCRCLLSPSFSAVFPAPGKSRSSPPPHRSVRCRVDGSLPTPIPSFLFPIFFLLPSSIDIIENRSDIHSVFPPLGPSLSPSRCSAPRINMLQYLGRPISPRYSPLYLLILLLTPHFRSLLTSVLRFEGPEVFFFIKGKWLRSHSSSGLFFPFSPNFARLEFSPDPLTLGLSISLAPMIPSPF